MGLIGDVAKALIFDNFSDAARTASKIGGTVINIGNHQYAVCTKK